MFLAATIERIVEQATDRRQQAILALLAYGGLRRSEVVGLNVGDFDGDFGLTRVKGKVAMKAVYRCRKLPWRS